MDRNHLFKHWRLITLVFVIILISWFLYALRSTLFPFALGLVLAYILKPVVTWVENKLPYPGKYQELKRVTVIVFTFLILLGVLSILFVYITSVVIDSFSGLVRAAPAFLAEATQRLQGWAGELRLNLPPEMQRQLDDTLQKFGVALVEAARNTFLTGIAFIPATVGFIFGFATLPLFLFYLLKDWERMSRTFYSAFPARVAEHLGYIVSIIGGVMGSYIRAQLVLCTVIGIVDFIGLSLLGISYAPALAVLAGITEAIPTVGPLFAGIIAVIVALAVDPSKAVWVALLFTGVQVLEGSLLVPRIHGAYFHIHPALLLVLMVVAAHFAGFWGLLLVAPVTATAVQVYKYARRAAKLEDGNEPEWPVTPPNA